MDFNHYNTHKNTRQFSMRPGAVAKCEAPIPRTLTYSEKQKHLFGTPAQHEKIFAEAIGEKSSIGHASYGDDEISIENISPNYTDHFQNMLSIIHKNCILVNDNIHKTSFNEICDVVNVDICVKALDIELQCIEFRPCAQMLGLFNIIVCQLLRTCLCTKKNLVIFYPVRETIMALESLFGKLDSDLKAHINKCVSLSEFKSQLASLNKKDKDYIEKTEEILKKCREEAFAISIKTIQKWAKYGMDIRKMCRVDTGRTIGFDENNILIINAEYLPTAAQMNDPAAVNRRVELAQELRNACIAAADNSRSRCGEGGGTNTHTETTSMSSSLKRKMADML